MIQKKTIALVLAALLLVSVLACCGKEPEDPENPSQPQESTTVDSTADHPALQIAGNYTESKTGAGSLEVTLAKDDVVYLAVRWISDSGESLSWMMSGTYNKRKNTVEYEDGVKLTAITLDDGSSDSIVSYHDGKGVFTFAEDGVHWTDDEEHFADNAVFIRT